jgi:putative Mg2+ transporter-C (MgtC) family protein
MEELISIEDNFVKIFVSILIGALIGAEREYKSKNAGFRTIILVTLGSTLFTIISELVTQGKDYHVIGNIVVGIGFLGAGAIFKDGNNTSGLTTAVTIWIAAAIGMAIGTGQIMIAVFSSFMVVLILVGFASIQYYIDDKNREIQYKICIKNELAHRNIVNEMILESGLKAKYSNTCGKNNELTYTITIKGANKNHHHFLTLLSDSQYIISFES